jgi:DNA-binding PadR family transcriptional regulator
MKTSELPNTSYIILGLLTLGEKSGYDLKWMLDRSFRHFYWAPAKSQIYGELRRLEAQGLVTARDVAQEQRPDKRLYRLTPEGHEAIQHWMVEEDVKVDRYKSPFLAKLFFGHMLPRERLFALLDTRRRQLTQDITSAEEKQQELQSRLSDEQDLLFPLLTLEYKLACFHAELDWLNQTLHRLQERLPATTE